MMEKKQREVIGGGWFQFLKGSQRGLTKKRYRLSKNIKKVAELTMQVSGGGARNNGDVSKPGLCG